MPNVNYSCPLVTTHCHNSDTGTSLIGGSYLDEMVDHEGSDAGSPPLRMNKQEGDVGLVVLHVWHHETKANHDLLIEDNNAEVGILQTL